MITLQVISWNQKLSLVFSWSSGHADKLVHEVHVHETEFARRLRIM